METELTVGVEAVNALADRLISIGHPTRLRIVQYCSQPRRFTDIIFNLQLNPASFKFHAKDLMDYGLIRRVERGIYETTELGKTLLELVNRASKIFRGKR